MTQSQEYHQEQLAEQDAELQRVEEERDVLRAALREARELIVSYHWRIDRESKLAKDTAAFLSRTKAGGGIL